MVGAQSMLTPYRLTSIPDQGITLLPSPLGNIPHLTSPNPSPCSNSKPASLVVMDQSRPHQKLIVRCRWRPFLPVGLISRASLCLVSGTSAGPAGLQAGDGAAYSLARAERFLSGTRCGREVTWASWMAEEHWKLYSSKASLHLKLEEESSWEQMKSVLLNSLAVTISAHSASCRADSAWTVCGKHICLSLLDREMRSNYRVGQKEAYSCSYGKQHNN